MSPSSFRPHSLHDSLILSITRETLTPDYTRRPVVYNRLTLALDARGALFDSRVTGIEFDNCRVVSGDLDAAVGTMWWYDDDLTRKGDRYELRITFSTGKGKDHPAVVLSFTDLRVTRTGDA